MLCAQLDITARMHLGRFDYGTSTLRYRDWHEEIDIAPLSVASRYDSAKPS